MGRKKERKTGFDFEVPKRILRSWGMGGRGS
jgi:hypothetical protein